MPLGPAQSYLATYNSYTLPGYVQSESFDSVANIEDHYATYADGSLSEYTGLQNKQLSLRLKVWECDYLTAKMEVEKAATILRSKRSGFANLYIQSSDRYYEALVQTIRVQKEAGTSVRTLEYDVEFECKPWAISVSGHELNGTGLIDTDQVGRTIDNGGWTPTRFIVDGTNVTVSGYTSTGDFTGFVSISGTVAGLVVDSDTFTATIAGVNKNEYMYWADYRLYVGPGKTYFNVTGATQFRLVYNDRWYL